MRHMEIPRLAHHGAHGRLRAEERLHPGVLVRLDTPAPRHPEGADGRVAQPKAPHLLEERDILLIAERIPTFDEVKLHVVEPLGDCPHKGSNGGLVSARRQAHHRLVRCLRPCARTGELVVQREADSLALRAIAQGRVVQRDVLARGAAESACPHRTAPRADRHPTRPHEI